MASCVSTSVSETKASPTAKISGRCDSCAKDDWFCLKHLATFKCIVAKHLEKANCQVVSGVGLEQQIRLCVVLLASSGHVSKLQPKSHQFAGFQICLHCQPIPKGVRFPTLRMPCSQVPAALALAMRTRPLEGLPPPSFLLPPMTELSKTCALCGTPKRRDVGSRGSKRNHMLDNPPNKGSVSPLCGHDVFYLQMCQNRASL